VSGADLAQADPEARLQHALELAYRYLGRRDRTREQVRAQLQKGEVDEATTEATLAELERQGAVDDERYARLFAEDRRRLDGWGSDRIAARLAEYGVPRHVIDAELGGLEPADELAGALDVLRGRLASPPASERERERALGLLVRRGYPLETAYDAVRAFEGG
jgi:regulatory protein